MRRTSVYFAVHGRTHVEQRAGTHHRLSECMKHTYAGALALTFVNGLTSRGAADPDPVIRKQDMLPGIDSWHVATDAILQWRDRTNRGRNRLGNHALGFL